MDFIQNGRLSSFASGVHLESVGKGKVQFTSKTESGL